MFSDCQEIIKVTIRLLGLDLSAARNLKVPFRFRGKSGRVTAPRNSWSCGKRSAYQSVTVNPRAGKYFFAYPLSWISSPRFRKPQGIGIRAPLFHIVITTHPVLLRSDIDRSRDRVIREREKKKAARRGRSPSFSGVPRRFCYLPEEIHARGSNGNTGAP